MTDQTASTKLQGLSALVTGADRGVGKGIALELARCGCRVAVNYRSSADRADQTVSEIQALGVEAVAVQADVGVAADVRRMTDSVIDRFGQLNLLVNNAGVQTWKPLLEVTEEEWDLVIDTNLKGCFLCTQAAALHMKAIGGGSIVNIGSGCNRTPFPTLVAYTASKGGIEMFTKVASRGARAYGIRVNCVAQAPSRSNARSSSAQTTPAPGDESRRSNASAIQTTSRPSWLFSRVRSRGSSPDRPSGSMADCSVNRRGRPSEKGDKLSGLTA
jgi:NAD(P)-dependent dehydrogenase (short-subunit alcohol dehydrogenase family)